MKHPCPFCEHEVETAEEMMEHLKEVHGIEEQSHIGID